MLPYLGVLTCEGESAEFAQLCDSLNVTVRGYQIVAEVEGGERHKGMETFERRETVVREVQEYYMFQYLWGGGRKGEGEEGSGMGREGGEEVIRRKKRSVGV